jgi:FkbM family methyltransferase
MITYGQNCEDVMLWRALKEIDEGFYVDIGAAWPEMHSVTKTFYDKGWRGINVEPNPELHAQLCKLRPRDINIQLAVSDREGEVELNLVPGTGLSTLDAGVARGYVNNSFRSTPLQVSCSTLATILRTHLPEGQEIHFLKVDVEGLESEVLRGNDWSINRPWIVVVESTRPLSQVESHQAWEPGLIAAGYLFAYADGLNRFYVEKSRRDLLAAFKYPPNVFDEFITASEANAAELQRRAEARAASAGESQRRAEARAADAEESQRRAEARVTALNDELMALLGSKSWRLTRPLREIVMHSKRLKRAALRLAADMSAAQPAKLDACVRRQLRSFVYGNSAIKRFLLVQLNRFPRIRFFVHQAIRARVSAPAARTFTEDRNQNSRLAKMEKIVAFTIAEMKSGKK